MVLKIDWYIHFVKIVSQDILVYLFSFLCTLVWFTYYKNFHLLMVLNIFFLCYLEEEYLPNASMSGLNMCVIQNAEMIF